MAKKHTIRLKRSFNTDTKDTTPAKHSSVANNRPKPRTNFWKITGLSTFVFGIFFCCSLYALIRHYAHSSNLSKSVQNSTPTFKPFLKDNKRKGTKKQADNRVKKSTPEQQVPPEIKNFKTTIHKTLFPRLITRNGRKIKFTELSHGNKKSSVRVYMAEDFLSKQECDGLMRVHLRHVASTAKKSPIVCFADLDTMRKHLDEAGYKGKTSMEDFTKGTFCVNESFSQKIAPSFKYSYSTAFYRDESKFAATFEELLESATGLARSHGGKFQITSYEHGVGYKNHTDCVEDNELRDRFATVLVYLQDVKVGGETKFPQLGISVKPKRGRLIVWNNMRPDGSCDPTSIHNAAKVVDGRKVIIQRWYYYQNFYSLGKRPPEPELPKRQELQPCVLCDEYVQGSCRWYDEWGYSHLINYRLLQHKLS